MKTTIRVGIIISSVIIAIILYLFNFSVDTSNMNDKLKKYIHKGDLSIISDKTIDGYGDKYIFVHYEFDNSNGIALLDKGINNKYKIRNTDFTDNEIAFVEYLIDGNRYFAIYGKGKENISKLNVEFTGKGDISQNIDNNDVLIIIKDSLEVELVDSYEIENEYGKKKVKQTNGESLNKGSRSSGPKGIVVSAMVLIVLLSYIVTLPLSNKFKRFKGDVVDQRIQQKHKMY